MNNYVLSDQFVAAAVSVLFGIASGAVYDVFRVLRVLMGLNTCTGGKTLYGLKMPVSGYIYRPPTKGRFSGVMLALGDIAFFTLWGASFAVLTCHISSGHVRWYSVIPMLCGFAAYYFTCGKIVMSAARYAAFALWAVGGYVIFILLLPIRLVVKAFKWMCRTVMTKVIRPVMEKTARAAALRKTEKMIASVGRLVTLDGCDGEG